MTAKNWTTLLRVGTLICLLAGVLCQFLQTTDRRPPLSYFTVDSALLAACTLSASLAFPSWRRIEHIRGTAVVAVVISGIVFASIIAPGTNGGSWFAPHDDPFARAATLLMHGVSPILISLDYVAHPIHSLRPSADAFRWLIWPLGYFAMVGPLATFGVLNFPYEFLNPDIVGAPVAVLAFIVVGVAYWTASLAFIAAGNRLALRKPSFHSV